MTLELHYFEDQLRYLRKHRYQSLFLDEYFQCRNNQNAKSENNICLTFDDGYLDNYIYVFPLLKKYGMKATIFVSPEFVDTKSPDRKTLEDYWNNRMAWKDLDAKGFLSWEEMRVMERSGLVDIQSHTLTHTKYFVSANITDFHNPRADYLYPIGNLFPDRKPYYLIDAEFEKLLPYGYPFFAEKSAAIARRVFINEEFNREIIAALKGVAWHNGYGFHQTFQTIKPIYERYKRNESLISGREAEAEYQQRVRQEVELSKKIIEKELEKQIAYCCWPHGDNDEYAHQIALQVGYKATTVGKSGASPTDPSRFERIGMGSYKDNLLLTRWKTKYKIKSYEGKQPYSLFNRLYKKIRYGN